MTVVNEKSLVEAFSLVTNLRVDFHFKLLYTGFTSQLDTVPPPACRLEPGDVPLLGVELIRRILEVD